MIVSIALNPSIDKLAVVDRVSIGEIHRPASVTSVAGGKGLNAARAAHALGASVRTVCLVGGHAGAWIVDALHSEGVDVIPVVCAHESRSSLSVYGSGSGRLTEFYEPGPPVTPEEWEGFVDAVSSVLPGSSWATVSGSIPVTVPAREVGRLVSLARESGSRVAVDVRGEPLARALDAGPDLVKINRSEALDLLAGMGAPSDASVVDGWEEIVGAAEVLRGGTVGPQLRRGARWAVVTDGSRGAVLSTREGDWVAEVPDEGPYPVGSGDAFLGGMVAALDRGADVVEAFRSGCAAGAANARVPGAGRLDPLTAGLLAELITVNRWNG